MLEHPVTILSHIRTPHPVLWDRNPYSLVDSVWRCWTKCAALFPKYFQDVDCCFSANNCPHPIGWLEVNAISVHSCESPDLMTGKSGNLLDGAAESDFALIGVNVVVRQLAHLLACRCSGPLSESGRPSTSLAARLDAHEEPNMAYSCPPLFFL